MCRGHRDLEKAAGWASGPSPPPLPHPHGATVALVSLKLCVSDLLLARGFWGFPLCQASYLCHQEGYSKPSLGGRPLSQNLEHYFHYPDNTGSKASAPGSDVGQRHEKSSGDWSPRAWSQVLEGPAEQCPPGNGRLLDTSSGQEGPCSTGGSAFPNRSVARTDRNT